jgi:hypothetical protein
MATKNEITDLGGVNLGNNNQRLGYPIGGVWDRKGDGFLGGRPRERTRRSVIARS